MTNIYRRFTGGRWKWKAYLGSGSRKLPVGKFTEDPGEAYATYLEARKREEELPRRIMTLGEAAVALLRRTDLECSPHTLRGRKARVKRFFDDDDSILRRDAYAAEVSANDIREALKLRQTRHGVSSNTIIDDWAFLHAIFREAGFPDTKNPVREVRKPKRSQVRMQFFIRDELDEIIRAIRNLSSEFPTAEPDADLIEVFTYAGFRNLELSRLRIDGIEFAPPDAAVGGYFKVRRKRGGVCSHPFAKRLIPALKRLIDRARLQHGRSYQGGLLGSDELKVSLLIAGTCKNWKSRLTKRGIKSARHLSARSLRHSYGTDLVRSGASIKVVQELLGHSNLSSTQRYIHAVNSDVDEAIVTAHR